MITKSREEQIQMNLKELNLNLIQKTMEFLNWTWKDSETGRRKVPSTKDLSVVAIECMKSAWNSDDKFFSRGGFEAEVIGGTLEIRFILTKANPLSKLLG